MFRRRTSSRWGSNFRSRGFGARRGPLTRVATRPKIWNRANFYFDNAVNVPNTSDSCTNSAVLLARHLNLAEISNVGFGYSNQLRWLEVGGVVFDYGFRRESGYDATLGASAQQVTQGVTLATDRLDTTGAPVTAATVQWQRVQEPVGQVSSTGVPASTAQNVDYPTKIHWRKWERKPHYAVTVNAGEQLVAPEGQYLDARNATINKRLRLRLPPEHGLFLIFSVVTGPSYAAGGTLAWSFWAQGQIYWRTRL